ncbi:MAG: VTT domain-containing protein [Kouleothrix sp.]|nr:VTT domain-containing protein [Kouleothrix sp.]
MPTTAAPYAGAPTTAAHHARDKRRALVRALAFGALAVLLNVAAYYLLPPDLVRRLGAFSYLGVFLITLLANATTIVPTPYIPIVACMAAQSDNLPLLIVAGALGSALGESVAFFIGRSGRAMFEETRFYLWVHRQLQHPWRAFAVLFVLSAPPNPTFDVAGLAAGALDVPYWLFFTAVFLSRMIRIAIIAGLGIRFCTAGA